MSMDMTMTMAMYNCVCVCVRVRVCVCVCVYVRICVYNCIYVYVYGYGYIHIHIDIVICIELRVYQFILSYSCWIVRALSWSALRASASSSQHWLLAWHAIHPWRKIFSRARAGQLCAIATLITCGYPLLICLQLNLESHKLLPPKYTLTSSVGHGALRPRMMIHLLYFVVKWRFPRSEYWIFRLRLQLGKGWCWWGWSGKAEGLPPNSWRKVHAHWDGFLGVLGHRCHSNCRRVLADRHLNWTWVWKLRKSAEVRATNSISQSQCH